MSIWTILIGIASLALTLGGSIVGAIRLSDRRNTQRDQKIEGMERQISDHEARIRLMETMTTEIATNVKWLVNKRRQEGGSS